MEFINDRFFAPHFFFWNCCCCCLASSNFWVSQFEWRVFIVFDQIFNLKPQRNKLFSTQIEICIQYIICLFSPNAHCLLIAASFDVEIELKSSFANVTGNATIYSLNVLYIYFPVSPTLFLSLRLEVLLMIFDGDWIPTQVFRGGWSNLSNAKLATLTNNANFKRARGGHGHQQSFIDEIDFDATALRGGG